MKIDDVIVHWRQYNEYGLDSPSYVTCGRLEFDRQVLKSYYIPIACYHPPRFASEKQGFALFLSDNVTSPWGTLEKHKWRARTAVTWTKFFVPYIGVHNGYASPHALIEAHPLNIKWMLSQINDMAIHSIRQFQTRSDGDHYGSMANFRRIAGEKYGEIENYMAWSGAEAELPPLQGIIDRVRNEREERWVAWCDPKAMERRERYAARKAAIQALSIGD